MQYRIEIVEDNPAEAELLESYFHRYCATGHDSFQIQRFHDGREFLNNYHPIYDLIMMDINLPKCNGLDAAVYLRKIDQSVALMFVTSMIQYAAKGYEVDVMDFLLKPVSYQSFSLKLQRALRRIEQHRTQEILVPLQDGLFRISISRLKYIEVTNHSLIYHTTEGNISSRGKLSELEARLNNPTFVRCNRCYLVNLAFVRSIQGSVLVVDTDYLQISRPKRAAVLEALNNYLCGGM